MLFKASFKRELTVAVVVSLSSGLPPTDSKNSSLSDISVGDFEEQEIHSEKRRFSGFSALAYCKIAASKLSKEVFSLLP